MIENSNSINLTPTLPKGYLEGFLRWLKESDYTTLTYDDLIFPPKLGKEGEEFTAWINQAMEKQEKGILIQYDMDKRSDINHHFLRYQIELGLPSSIMIFRERVSDMYVRDEGRLVHDHNYIPDFKLYEEFQKIGGVIGYHCNAFEHALKDTDQAVEIFRKDIEYLRQHLDLKYFSMHGGVVDSNGMSNSALPVEAIVDELDLTWVHNSNKGYSIYFHRNLADGGLSSMNYRRECSDLAPFVAATQTGERSRILIHPQYYAEDANDQFEIPVISDYQWVKDTQEAIKKPGFTWDQYWTDRFNTLEETCDDYSSLMNDVETHSPVFINGMSRSGTTLLVSILDAHPDGAMAYESYPHYIMREFNGAYYGREEYLYAAEVLVNLPENDAFSLMKERGLDRLITFAAVSTWTGMTLPQVGHLLRAYAVRKKSLVETTSDALDLIAGTGQFKIENFGGKFWGTKADGNFQEYFDKFPKASLIYIQRDGLDILASQMTKGAFNPDAEKLGRSWKQSFENANAFVSNSGYETCAMVKYEALALDPESTMRSVCEKIGIPFHPQMVKQYEADSTMTKNPRGQLSAERVQQPIDTSSIGRWRDFLSETDIENFLRGCGGKEFYESMGYSLTSKLPVAKNPDAKIIVPTVATENLSAEKPLVSETESAEKAVPAKIKQPQQLELAHFLHLKRLMMARRETMPETIDYLINTHDLDSDKDWLAEWYKPANPNEMHNLTMSAQQKQDGIDIDRLKRAIQDLPQWIKSLTDRITTSDYSFSKLDFQGQEVQGVTLNKTTFYDNAPVTYRDEGMHRVLHDTFPKPMSVEEYRMLNMAQSQYSTLLEDPLEYSMPKTGQIAVDAGAFIGYKAVAFGRAVSPLGKVYAFEIDPFNFNLMKEVIKANNMQDYVHPVFCALAPEEGDMEVMTRDPGSMGHSMIDFDGFSPTEKTVVKTRRLDSVFKELGLDYVDVLHVSVNGFERQVLEGLGDFVHKVGVFNVQAPYSVGGVNLEESIKEYFEENNIKVYGKAQAAVVAGPEAKYYKYR